MCGIAGHWGAVDEPKVREMLRMIAHRGPDAEGVHVSPGHGVIGSRRLAIMDPEHGHQPLYSEDRSRVLVANGEIYNYPSLRRELSGRHALATGSDSEIIIHLHEDLGDAATARLDGMFGFALVAGSRLLLARDPMGIKPLYYGFETKGDGRRILHFASELKALADASFPIRALSPGSTLDSDGVSHTFYKVPLHKPEDRDPLEWARRVREALAASVERHLMSDVPVGVFLSGGLDSSIVAAMARRYVTQLHTFSVGFEGSQDLEAARRVAAHLGTIHHERILTENDLITVVPEVVRQMEHFAPELVTHAIPTWHAARLAREHVKVVLVGEGADELFGGYGYFKKYLRAGKTDLLWRELHRCTATLHANNLQRVDRMTMAHGLEARVPFLDTALVDLAMRIPISAKFHMDASGADWTEKWVLRLACDGLLPDEILWRPKAAFGHGSGVVERAEVLLDAYGAHGLGAEAARRYPHWKIATDEEAMYHRVLIEAYGDNPVFLDNCDRWVLDILRSDPNRKVKPRRRLWQRVRRWLGDRIRR